MNRLSAHPLARTSLLACAGVFLCSALLRGQASQNVIDKVLVEGGTRFSSAQILLAGGLKIGQPADDAALSAAADRLANTGAFSSVTYQYRTANSKMTLTFQITDQPKMMDCTFDNFVWFTHEDVERAVRADVPLYDGRVPLDGGLPQDVAHALEHLLAQRHVTATVTYLPAARALGAAPTEFRYSASRNLPPVTSVEFSGGSLSDELFAVQEQRLIGRPFSAAYSHSLAENDLTVVYRNHAYLRAQFDDPQVTFQPSQNESDPGSVRLVFHVSPGPQFMWHGADWIGNKVYASADLDRHLAMKEGEPAAADKISAGLDAVREAYGKVGYIAMALSSKPSLDDASRQVRYSFELAEGAQYRMGSFKVEGYDSQTAERIGKTWQLKPGEVYDASYPKEFMKKGVPAPANLSPAAAKTGKLSLATRLNKDQLVADVVLAYSTN